MGFGGLDDLHGFGFQCGFWGSGVLGTVMASVRAGGFFRSYGPGYGNGAELLGKVGWVLRKYWSSEGMGFGYHHGLW